MAEGQYGGFFGWPNLSLKPTGGYLGMPPYPDYADMRVVDIYRGKAMLAENWIFITCSFSEYAGPGYSWSDLMYYFLL